MTCVPTSSSPSSSPHTSSPYHWDQSFSFSPFIAECGFHVSITLIRPSSVTASRRARPTARTTRIEDILPTHVRSTRKHPNVSNVGGGLRKSSLSSRDLVLDTGTEAARQVDIIRRERWLRSTMVQKMIVREDVYREGGTTSLL